jgi:hypothetical protein
MNVLMTKLTSPVEDDDRRLGADLREPGEALEDLAWRHVGACANVNE